MIFILFFLFLTTTIYIFVKTPYLLPILKNDIILLLFIPIAFVSFVQPTDYIFNLLVMIPILLILLKIFILNKKKIFFLELNTIVLSESKTDKYFIYLFILFILFLLTLTDFTNPRGFYESLIADNREGGILFSVLKFFLMLLASYAYNIRNMLLLLIVSFLIGSKGIIIYIFTIYFIYKVISKDFTVSKIIFLFVFFVVTLMYVLNRYTHGIDNFYEYYLYSYFDYIRNFYLVYEEIPILPDKNIIPWFNDMFLGLSKITGVYKNDLHHQLFPYEMSFGKAPGMLIYEAYFRIGILFFIIFYFISILYQLLVLQLAVSFKSPSVLRFVYISGAYRFLLPILIVLKLIGVKKK
jgi:hypothetical protein